METMVAKEFTIDDGFKEDISFIGFENESKGWNGWACPYFTKETAHQVVAALAEAVADFYEVESFGYEETTDQFFLIYDDYHDVWKAEQIIVNGETLTVYPIGAESYTWEVVK